MRNGSLCKKRKNEYKKEAVYKYALLKAKSLGSIINFLKNRKECDKIEQKK